MVILCNISLIFNYYNKKKSPGKFPGIYRDILKVLFFLFVAFLKLIDTPCSIYQHVFTGIKRVGGV